MKDFYVILFNTRDLDVKFLKNEGFYDKLCNEFKSYRIMNINLMGFFFFFFPQMKLQAVNFTIRIGSKVFSTQTGFGD